MAVKRIRNHGRRVWQARVAHRGFAAITRVVPARSQGEPPARRSSVQRLAS
jgi:hypothetical protein